MNRAIMNISNELAQKAIVLKELGFDAEAETLNEITQVLDVTIEKMLKPKPIAPLQINAAELSSEARCKQLVDYLTGKTNKLPRNDNVIEFGGQI